MKRLGALAASGVLLTACGGSREDDPAEATSIVTAGTGSADACDDDATPVTIEIANIGPSTVFLQSVGQSDMVSFSGEAGPLPGADCGQCSCEDCPDCAVCAGGLPEQILALAPGETTTTAWNGLYFPLLDPGEHGNTCGEWSCQERCAAPAGQVQASTVWSTWFTAVFPPSLIRQGATPVSASFAHPTTPMVRLEIDSPPPVDPPPAFTATLPDGAFTGAHVVASHNPSDPGGIEVIALAADGRYVALFAPAEAGAHPLMTGTNWRRATVGKNGEFEFEDTTTGTITIDAIDETRVAGSFVFTLAAGEVTGSFDAAFTN